MAHAARSVERRYRVRNTVHSVLLLGTSGVLLAAVGYLLAGELGMVLLLAVALISGLGGASVPAEMVVRLFRARPLSSRHVSRLYQAALELSERAGLPRAPLLYYVPSAMLNAFALGTPQMPIVALTDGLLRHLSLREICAVLAHEIAHIRHGDLRVMQLADALTRLTTAAAWVGQLLLLINLPIYLWVGVHLSWTGILLLVAAPPLTALAQLALSRAREYDADREAARLTGDPEALASALVKMEKIQARWFDWLFFPGRGIPHPSWLRTHPPTRERVRRLMAIQREQLAEALSFEERFPVLERPLPEVARSAPHWRWTGLWW